MSLPVGPTDDLQDSTPPPGPPKGYKTVFIPEVEPLLDRHGITPDLVLLARGSTQGSSLARDQLNSALEAAIYHLVVAHDWHGVLRPLAQEYQWLLRSQPSVPTTQKDPRVVLAVAALSRIAGTTEYSKSWLEPRIDQVLTPGVLNGPFWGRAMVVGCYGIAAVAVDLPHAHRRRLLQRIDLYLSDESPLAKTLSRGNTEESYAKRKASFAVQTLVSSVLEMASCLLRGGDNLFLADAFPERAVQVAKDLLDRVPKMQVGHLGWSITVLCEVAVFTQGFTLNPWMGVPPSLLVFQPE